MIPRTVVRIRVHVWQVPPADTSGLQGVSSPPGPEGRKDLLQVPWQIAIKLGLEPPFLSWQHTAIEKEFCSVPLFIKFLQAITSLDPLDQSITMVRGGIICIKTQELRDVGDGNLWAPTLALQMRGCVS